jgi:enamine deaminase RidA (YjgF/YER057c/UK114 family)
MMSRSPGGRSVVNAAIHYLSTLQGSAVVIVRHFLKADLGRCGWPNSVRFSRGTRAADHMVVGAQADLDSNGQILHPGDTRAQLTAVVDHVVAILESLGGVLDDVVKLALYYVPVGDIQESQILEYLARVIDANVPPALTHLALPHLAYPGQVIALEAVAMRAEDGSALPRAAANPLGHWQSPFSHGLRCGEMIYIGAQMPVQRSGAPTACNDPVAQAHENLDRIGEILAGFGAELDDIARINTFYVGHGTAGDWARAASVRGKAFTEPGPCAAGIPVPTLLHDGLTIRQDAIAMLGTDGRRLPRHSESPVGHWNWPIKMNLRQGVRVGNKLFIGGQGALNALGEPIHPHDLPAQARDVMSYIGDVLSLFGAEFSDIMWMKSYHVPENGPTDLHTVLSVGSQFFDDPGPAITALPFPRLGIDPMALEVDAFAIIETQHEAVTNESEAPGNTV